MTTTAPCITISSSSRSSIASPPSTPNPIPNVSSSQQLSQLSRNASVISTSSSSSASSVAATPPTRPRPLRQFSYQPPSRPRSPTEQYPYDRTRSPSRQRTRSPHSPTTPRAVRAPPPVWVPRDLRPDSDEDDDSALPELSAPTSRRGSTVVHSRRGSAGTVRRPDFLEQRGVHSRSGSGSASGASDGARPVIAPPASPKISTSHLTGSPQLRPRGLAVGPGKRSRVPSTASSAAVLAGQLEAVARDVIPPPPPPHVHSSSNLNPSPQARHAAPSPSPVQGPRKRRTQSTSTTNARSRSTSAAPRQRQPVSAADFEFGEELGSGSYSTVVKAWFKVPGSGAGNGVMAGLAGAGGQSGDGKVYAVKVSDKQYLINKGKVKYANVEKTALALLGTGNQHRGHPGIVKLYWTFHDPMSLYFVLDLVPNGELLGRIKRLGSLTADGARYYTAQIVDAVGWMHGMGVVHRDLKPENILLDESFRVKITDFGSARVESGSPEVPSAPGTEGGGSAQPAAGVVPDQRASSFVGTAEYVSPELLIHNVTSRCSDVWAIGCILFQMLAGRPPFKGGSEYLTLEQVKRLEYTIPDGFDEVAAELVRSILVLNPASRPSIPSIRTHPFLAETVWDEIWTCDAPPMESGPVMGPPPPDSDEEEDVGEAWDRMVGADDDEDDDEEEEGGPMYFGPRHQGGDGGYQAGMAFRGVRMYGMGAGVGTDGAGDSTDDGVTPQAVQRPSYNFGEYKFGDAGAGETSTVPIPTTEDVPAPTQERDITEQPVVVVGPMRTEPGPIGLPTRLSLPPTLPVILSPGLTDTDNEIAVEDDDMVPELQSTNALTDQRARTDPLRASHSSTISGVGTTSSSEGSPLGSTVGARAGSGEGMPIVGGDVEGLRTALAIMGLGSDAERLSSALAPGERPVFMSSILSRPRHRLTAVLPSKRRILVLTNTPRLLCMKEQRDRVVVKSELAFLGPATRPASVKSASSTGTPTTITGRGRSLARWKSTSSAPGGGSAGSVGSSSGAAVAAAVSASEKNGPEVEPIALETVQSVETKGEKSFIIQTLSKAYTYVADNPEEATRWVQQIKEAQNRKPRRASMLSSRPN